MPPTKKEEERTDPNQNNKNAGERAERAATLAHPFEEY